MRWCPSIILASAGAAVLAACGLSIAGVADVSPDASTPDAAPATPLDGTTSTPAADGASSCADGAAGCGGCDRDCLGGACVAGECQPTVFASGEPGARGVAVIGANLVWTRETAGVVRSKPLAGGDATTVFTVTGGNMTDVTGDGQRIYATDRARGRLYRRQGGSTSDLNVSPTPTGIALDGNTLYFTVQNQDNVSSIEVPDAVVAVRVRMAGLNFPADVAVSEGRIYAASASGILVAPAGPGTPVTTVSPTSTFKDGGGDLLHTGLAVAGGTAWFSIGELGIVASIPTTGGTARVLARGQSDPQGIAVTESAVFWANRGDGTIMRLAR